jgi:type II secretory pathway pseudopilin PulG
LIVIALLGVLATAVLAAINPLEQANRARDARMRSDASQLLAAIDRYYVAADHFPWVVTGAYTNDNVEFPFTSASNVNVGICGATCNDNGLLITSNELKSEFKNRDFTKSTATATDLLYIGKASSVTSNVAESVYACWVPRSKTERGKATKTITTTSATMVETTTTDCATKAYNDLSTSCVSCLPN